MELIMGMELMGHGAIMGNGANGDGANGDGANGGNPLYHRNIIALDVDEEELRCDKRMRLPFRICRRFHPLQ